MQRLTAALNMDQIDHDAVLDLALQIDEKSTYDDEPRYAAARELLVSLGVDKVRLKEVRPTAQTVSRFILYLSEYLGISKIVKLINEFPQIVSLSEENLEGRRKYLELDKKKFIELILKFPPIVNLSEENLEGRRKYLELDKKKFIELILKYPPVVGHSEENLEGRRKYLELDKKKFIELILKFSQIISYSEENLERKFSYYERHFGESRMDIINRVINGQAFLLSCSFYTRILLRVKYASCFMNERVETLDDVIRLICPKEDKFLKMLRGADLSEYAELRGMSEVLKNTNGPVKSKQR